MLSNDHQASYTLASDHIPSSATVLAHATTPGFSGQCTLSNPTSRASVAEVSPMHTAVAAVPARSAHTRTYGGGVNRVRLNRARNSMAFTAQTL